jgi:hypothetical protein
VGSIAFGYAKKHVLELLNPQTPSYKTSFTAIPLFLILAFSSGDRHALFWISMACVVFFSLVAVAQYGFFSRSRRVI